MTTQTPKRFEDRLLGELMGIVAKNEAPVAASQRRRPRTLRLLAWAAPLALAGIAFAIVSLLSSPRPGLAEAAVIRRASMALAEPKGILYVKERVHGRDDAICLGMELPYRCIGHFGGDGVAYTDQSWMDGSEDVLRTVYGTGDETVVQRHRESLYDPSEKTLTVITKASEGAVTAFRYSDIDGLTIPQIRNLYRHAKDGGSDVQLLGKTRIRGIEAYELRMDEDSQPIEPRHHLIQHSFLLLYLDAKTFLPMRIVEGNFVYTPRGLVHKSRTTNSVDITAKLIPATSANRRLLKVAAHPGAKTVRMTEAQMMEARAKAPSGLSRSWRTSGK